MNASRGLSTSELTRSEHEKRYRKVASLKVQGALFLASFLALYFEVLVIRYVSAELIAFGVLKNLPLIASFCGLGIGMLQKERLALSRRLFPFVTATLFLLARFGQHIPLPSLSWEYGLSSSDKSRALVVLVFLVCVTAVLWLIVGFFAVLGSFVGEYMNSGLPLSAYAINLAGSLAGILTFTLLSFLRTPPAVWIGIGFLLLLPFLWRHWFDILMLAIVLAIIALPQPDTHWSPYHRIDVQPIYAAGDARPSAYQLSYNHLWYQTMVDLSPDFMRQHPEVEPNRSVADYYELPYRFVAQPRNVLIVGAGTGNDVAAALRHGALHVDAVEIDPVILDMGRRFHPERPYGSSRVTEHVEDARTFLSRSKQKYDVIVFGFLDSATLLTSFSSLRLDNYVYTRESFAAARSRLTTDGSLFLSFAVAHGFVVNRLFATLSDAFGLEPRAFETPTRIGGMLYVQGAARSAQISGVHEVTRAIHDSSQGTIVATDYWPFLYLEKKSVPMSLVTLLLAFVVSAWIWQRKTILRQLHADGAQFFLLGAGFLLVETSTITRLSLLFGSTWVVNASVISAFLLMAFVANALARRFTFNASLCYFALLVVLAIGTAVPYSWFTGTSIATKLFAVALWAALPVVFSGIIFSSALRNVASAADALGINILGAILGGVLENTVLLGGTVLLGVIAIILYGGAWLFGSRRSMPVVTASDAPGAPDR
jgi:hypothetical protein